MSSIAKYIKLLAVFLIGSAVLFFLGSDKDKSQAPTKANVFKVPEAKADVPPPNACDCSECESGCESGSCE